MKLDVHRDLRQAVGRVADTFALQHHQDRISTPSNCQLVRTSCSFYEQAKLCRVRPNTGHGYINNVNWR